MSVAREIYKPLGFGDDYIPSSYQPIVNHFGSILVQVDDSDYQGSTRVVYLKDGKYGFLVFGWGSCSGCDALQACSTFEEVDDLIGQLERSIKWFDTLDELKAYILNDDERSGSHYWHETEWEDFKAKVEAL